MGVPMEVKLAIDQNSNASKHSFMLLKEKFVLLGEVFLKSSSTTKIDNVRVKGMLKNRSLSYIDGPIHMPINELFLTDIEQRIFFCDTNEGMHNGSKVEVEASTNIAAYAFSKYDFLATNGYNV
ncbi:hypothetical protein VNO77_26738 [Canavalia gladiata]|uniref:Uncharacterized protein n=1 Tax=Canavalia gladiata TaxID=3824 RepID=A0AAN9KXK6_CANGL